MTTFAENLAKLPPIDDVERIDVYDKADNLIHSIPNAEGKKGSLKLFNYLAVLFDNRLNYKAARKGIEIFAEITEDAIANPGKHPNIDLLLKLADSENNDYRLSIVYFAEA